AISAAWLGALLLTYTERRWPEVQEAIIGVVFAVAASSGLLLLANSPHGGEHLQDLLAGQILWVGYAQLWPMAVLTMFVLAIWYGFKDRLGRLGFYLLFATTVTASVQLVGVYLVFASLIIPALALRYWPPRWVLPAAYVLGASAYALGLALSTHWDLPSGALIVLCLALLGVVAAAFTPLLRARGVEPQ
ncbi:MAG: metal ABC transporter permease, partial [Gammaproteobacteria bacterium]|nr:metal ABC transporter permease [Gammaproteobacteria bacterium]